MFENITNRFRRKVETPQSTLPPKIPGEHLFIKDPTIHDLILRSSLPPNIQEQYDSAKDHKEATALTDYYHERDARSADLARVIRDNIIEINLLNPIRSLDPITDRKKITEITRQNAAALARITHWDGSFTTSNPNPVVKAEIDAIASALQNSYITPLLQEIHGPQKPKIPQLVDVPPTKREQIQETLAQAAFGHFGKQKDPHTAEIFRQKRIIRFNTDAQKAANAQKAEIRKKFLRRKVSVGQASLREKIEEFMSY